MMLDDISLFIAVVEAGSLKLASERLLMPASTLSRRLQTLEDKLNCKLLNRNSHHFEMTREGRGLYDKTRFHLDSVSSIIEGIKEDIETDSGLIKVLAPTNLMTSQLQTHFADYLTLHPAIQLELSLDNALTPFYAADADFAIRVGRQQDSDLTQFKLGHIDTLLVASRAYIEANHPIHHPEDLQGQDCIVGSSLVHWTLRHESDKDNPFTWIPDNKSVRVNDLQVAKQFAIGGHGIALLPMTEIKDALLNQSLIPVLPAWQGNKREVYIVWYRRQFLSQRASHLIDYLQQHVCF